MESSIDRKWKNINVSPHLKVCSKKVGEMWDPGYVLVKAFINVPQQIMIFLYFLSLRMSGQKWKIWPAQARLGKNLTVQLSGGVPDVATQPV